jgi:hypothetical protein
VAQTTPRFLYAAIEGSGECYPSRGPLSLTPENSASRIYCQAIGVICFHGSLAPFWRQACGDGGCESAKALPTGPSSTSTAGASGRSTPQIQTLLGSTLRRPAALGRVGKGCRINLFLRLLCRRDLIMLPRRAKLPSGVERRDSILSRTCVSGRLVRRNPRRTAVHALRAPVFAFSSSEPLPGIRNFFIALRIEALPQQC